MDTHTAPPRPLTPALFDITIGPVLESWIQDLIDQIGPDLPGLPDELADHAAAVDAHDDMLLMPEPFVAAATDDADTRGRLAYLQLLAAGGFTDPLPTTLRAPEPTGMVRQLTDIETVLVRLAALNARPKDVILIGAQEAMATTVELGDRTANHLDTTRQLQVDGAQGIAPRLVELPAWTWSRLAALPSDPTERIAHDSAVADRDAANSTGLMRTQWLLRDALPYTRLKPKSLRRTAAGNTVARVGFDEALRRSGMRNPDRFEALLD